CLERHEQGRCASHARGTHAQRGFSAPGADRLDIRIRRPLGLLRIHLGDLRRRRASRRQDVHAQGARGLNVRSSPPVLAAWPLPEIDPAPYELAVAKAKAQLELARQSASQESAGVASAEAVLAQRRAEAENARGIYQRNQQLQKSGFLSAQGIENSRAQLASADAAVKAAQANVAQARSALGTSGEGNAAVQAALAAVKQAELDLSRTRIA